MAIHKSPTHSFLEFFKNAFFPKFCFGCGRIGTYLCTKCSDDLRHAERDMCPVCGKSSIAGLTHPACKKHYGLDGFISFFRYEGLAKRVMVKLKYHLIYEAAQDMVDAVDTIAYQKLFFLKKKAPEIFLVPVPLHAKRERDRGFNQSEKLYKLLGKKVGIPIRNNWVIRTRYTTPQAHMKSKHDRAVNIIGAFSVSQQVKNKDIIICDDVWTTGATMKELCKELKKNGARHVYALTIARVYL